MPRWCDDIGSKNGRRRLKQRRTTNDWFSGSTAQTEESFPSGPIHPRIVTDELTPPPAKSAASPRGWPHVGHPLRRGGLASGLGPAFAAATGAWPLCGPTRLPCDFSNGL